MNQFEPYKRLIKLGFALILIALLTGLYGAIWINWYNKIIWAPFFRRGNWMMIFIYGLLLIFFMQLYGGFKIALLKRGNLIYSQILAVVFTNIITYFQISVQDKEIHGTSAAGSQSGRRSHHHSGMDDDISVAVPGDVSAERTAADIGRSLRLSSDRKDERPRR
ncbi:MAG: hypothetical protein ACLR8P_22075 [Clostridium fessum]